MAHWASIQYPFSYVLTHTCIYNNLCNISHILRRYAHPSDTQCETILYFCWLHAALAENDADSTKFWQFNWTELNLTQLSWVERNWKVATQKRQQQRKGKGSGDKMLQHLLTADYADFESRMAHTHTHTHIYKIKCIVYATGRQVWSHFTCVKVKFKRFQNFIQAHRITITTMCDNECSNNKLITNHILVSGVHLHFATFSWHATLATYSL